MNKSKNYTCVNKYFHLEQITPFSNKTTMSSPVGKRRIIPSPLLSILQTLIKFKSKIWNKEFRKKKVIVAV